MGRGRKAKGSLGSAGNRAAEPRTKMAIVQPPAARTHIPKKTRGAQLLVVCLPHQQTRKPMPCSQVIETKVQTSVRVDDKVLPLKSTCFRPPSSDLRPRKA